MLPILAGAIKSGVSALHAKNQMLPKVPLPLLTQWVKESKRLFPKDKTKRTEFINEKTSGYLASGKTSGSSFLSSFFNFFSNLFN